MTRSLPCRVAVDVSPVFETFGGGVGYTTAQLAGELVHFLGRDGIRFFSPFGTFSELPEGGPFSGGNGHSPLRSTRLYRHFHREFVLPRRIRSFEPGIVHFPDAKVPATLAGDRAVITVTVNDVGPFVGESPREDASRHRHTIRRGVEAADLVIAISEFTRTSLIDALGVDPSRVRTVHPGVSGRFRPIGEDRAGNLLRSRFGAEPGYFLSLGEVNERKNVLSLVEAHRFLPDSFRRQHPLVIAGRVDPKAGGSRGAYVRRVLDRVDEHVVLTGLVTEEEKIGLYGGSVAFVFPSRYEGFGLPVLEAMACGKAVIAGDNSAVSELHAGKALLLSDPSPSSLRRAMTRLVEDETFRRELEEAGRRHAAPFTWERTARGTLDAWREALRMREEGP